MPRRVTSFANTTIKRLRSLRDKKHRAAEGLFMAEGLRICTEALDAGHVPKILVQAEDDAHPLTAALAKAVAADGGEALEVPRALLAKISGKDNPQGVVGAFAPLDIRLERLNAGDADIWIACQELKDPGNLGTILRTADAVGAGGVIFLDRSCDPFSVEAVRASMGALFTVPLARTDAAVFFDWARDTMIVGTSLKATTDYQAPDYAAPTVVLMGNEQHGLPDDYEARCDALVKLPMRGRADSLNVAVSCAVMVYEVLNQRRRRT